MLAVTAVAPWHLRGRDCAGSVCVYGAYKSRATLDCGSGLWYAPRAAPTDAGLRPHVTGAGAGVVQAWRGPWTTGANVANAKLEDAGRILADGAGFRGHRGEGSDTGALPTTCDCSYNDPTPRRKA